METIVLIVHVILAIALVALVLLQQGKGAEAGAAFGSGASQTMFGSQGTSSFLGKITAVIATGIFATSFALAVYAKHKADAISGQGIPTPAAIEQRAGEPSEAPTLEQAPQSPASGDSDVPLAD